MIFHVISSLAVCFIFVNVAYAQPIDDPFANALTASETAVASENASPNAYPDFKDFAREYGSYSVPSITASRLQEEIDEGKIIYILDTRTEEEFNIGHIKGAKRVGFNDFTVERVWMINRRADVIVYSTTKDRSERVGEYLEMMGFEHVQILDGVIDWVNQGHDLIDSEGIETKNVHVRTKENLKLLKKGKGIY